MNLLEKHPWLLPLPFIILAWVFGTISTTFFPLWVQACAGIIAITLALIATGPAITRYADDLGCVGKLSLVVLALVVWGLVVRQLLAVGWPTKIQVQEKLEEVQKLRIRLIPEAVQKGNIALHFIVANDGPNDVEIVRSRVEVPPYMDSQSQSEERRPLRKGDELTIPVTTDNLLALIRFARLTFSYKTFPRNSLRTVVITFVTPANFDGPVSPTTTKDEVGMFGYLTEAESFEKHMRGSAFQYRFSFHEKWQEMPNNILLSAHGKTLDVNSANHTASFSLNYKGRLLTWGRRFEPSELGHVVTLVGRNADVKFLIDGQLANVVTE